MGPVCVTAHFGPWPLGPQHGFARIKRWTVAQPPKQDETGAVLATLTLRDDEETRKMWKAEFELVYTVQLHENSLRCVLAVHNTGHANIDFTCLLHTYLRVPDIKDTRVLGLRGVTYIDKVKDGKEFAEDREIYKNAPQTVFVQTGAHQRLEMTTSNLPDVVVWNPWKDKSREMADFDDDGWRYMLCVEAGKVVSPVVLEAGAAFECSVSFTVNPEHHGL
ncbi:hypothetical protein C0Q70_19774 [Pomacea canaliculata]|uniref:Galactose mutarotase n=1 Tax=Pomacea canaliculata TaxID=400727 RepID=A0A2T7NDP3_POMCA|nr:hypothetical protein C0Q70_19774 [Pomacea canaliculata]